MRRLVLAAAVALSPSLALAQASSSGTVKIPDGNDKALGATSDNAWGGVGSANLIQIMKGIYGQSITLGTPGSPSVSTVVTVQGAASMTPLLVGQPLNTAIGSITGAPVLQGYVSTNAPSYANGNTNALSLTTGGSLRVAITSGAIDGIGAENATPYTWDGGNATVISALKGMNALTFETGSAGTPAADVMTVQGCSGCTGIAVGDSFGVSASGKSGVAVQGVVSTDAPTGYDNGDLQPLSLDEAGNLRVTGNFGGTAQGAASASVQGPMAQSVTSTSTPSYSNATVNPLSTDGKGNLRVAAGADVCQSQPHTFTSVSTNGSAVIKAAAPSKITYICSIMLIANAAETISIVSGTGTACATSKDAMVGNSTVSDGIAIAANQGFVLGNGGFAVAASSSNEDICLLQSGTVRVNGVIVTAVEP